MAADCNLRPQIQIRAATSLTGSELRILYALSLKNQGLLCSWLKERCEYDYVVLCLLDSKIIGWAMLKRRNNRFWTNCGFYIAKRMRRRGYGTKLFKTVKRLALRLNFRMRRSAWDEVSSDFFRTMRKKNKKPLVA